jgi:hypothetical protein
MMMPENPTALMQWYARSLAVQCKALPGGTEIWAESVGCPDRVKRILKSAVAAGTTLDAAWAGSAVGDYRGIVAGFMEAMRTKSVFYRLLNDNAFTIVPLHKQIVVTTAAASGWILGEGKPVPLSRLSLANQMLLPVRAAALIVLSDALIRDTSTSGQSFFAKELRNAVGEVVDQKLFELIIDDATDAEVITSGGDDIDAILTDLRSALTAVTTGGNSALYWIAAPDVAKFLSTFPQEFPAASAVGGELVNLPMLISSGLAPGELVLLDAAGVAANADTITVKASTETDIEMSDAPAMDATAGTATAASVSMFQVDSVAIMATAIFGAELLRSDAVCKITGMGGVTA